MAADPRDGGLGLPALLNAACTEIWNGANMAFALCPLLSQGAIDALANCEDRIFPSVEAWENHLKVLGLTGLNVTPDPVQIATEGALWGAIHHQGLLQNTVIVSDDAGQFRVGVHALCWVHAERLVHKPVPANGRQRNAVEIAKRMIWWFYRSLKEYVTAQVRVWLTPNGGI